MDERAKQLDALVATHVFGWRLARSHRDELVWMADHPGLPGEMCYGHCTLPTSVATWGVDHGDLLPKFSTQIVAAWCVVERMRSLGWDFSVCAYTPGPNDARKLWSAEFWRWRRGRYDQFQVDDDSPMVAISRAALKALGVADAE